MSIELISEERLRAALSSLRVDPTKFEAGVRDRIKSRLEGECDAVSSVSPLWQRVASLFPSGFLGMPQELVPAAASSAPAVGIASKLLGYVAFPAVVVFLVLGSMLFLGVRNIRRIRSQDSSKPMDERALTEGVHQWWLEHRWGGLVLFVASIVLTLYGATEFLIALYLASTLVLLYVLKSLSRKGIGNRQNVAAACFAGLFFLGLLSGFPVIGASNIHFVEQSLHFLLFFLGSMIVLSFAFSGNRSNKTTSFSSKKRFVALVFVGVNVVAMTIFFLRPFIWPTTPARIADYVQSFDHAEFSSASWSKWETVAAYVIKTNPSLDLSRPRRLLAEQLIHEDDLSRLSIVGSALHAGLMLPEQVDQLKDYQSELRGLLTRSDDGTIRRIGIAPGLNDWVIRAAALRGDLGEADKDYLAARLRETLKWSLSQSSRTIRRSQSGQIVPDPLGLRDPLVATQLLEAIGRPVDPAPFRDGVHSLLLRTHLKTGMGFGSMGGGFRSWDDDRLDLPDLEGTADAVELMEYFGIPAGLDINWVRSSLKPTVFVHGYEKWISAVARERLNHLPGIKPVSWTEILYYEWSFLAAAVLIGLCIYATAISPNPKPAENEDAVSG